MTADEAKAALCAHLGIGAHHEWAYVVGYVEGRIIPAPSATPPKMRRHEPEGAPTEPGIYMVGEGHGDAGDRMELLATGLWRYLDGGNPGDPLPFVPRGPWRRVE